MENINLNELLDRITIENNIINILNNFNVSNNLKKGIFIYGNNGIGKTKFIKNLLKENNYDIIYYDNTTIRNKALIESIGSDHLCNTNVHSLFTSKPKKKVIVIDDIDGMNSGDKNGIISLIKVIRPKKTKKQKIEIFTNNPIICINNSASDKKILELMKVCEVFKLENPSNIQILNILNILRPNIFKYSKDVNNIISNNIIQFLDNKLTSINKIIFYENNNLIYSIFYLNHNISETNKNLNIKYLTKNFLENYHNFQQLDSILESDRTILSLLFHENLIKNLTIKDISVYLKLLENFIFSDYIDRIIFQKQIWQLIEINYIVKIFYNNFILKTNNLLKKTNIDDIIFTKILTKYSSEYNNYIFLYNCCQAVLLEKKDVYSYFYLNKDSDKLNELVDLLKNNNINKLEILRIIKLLNNILNYKPSINDKSSDSIDHIDILENSETSDLYDII